MRRLCLSLLLFCFVPILSAQYTVSGVVLDASSRQPLAFVNVVPVSGSQGVSADLDGKFSLNMSAPLNRIQFSYVGYETVSLPVTASTSGLRILLVRKSLQLSEVKILPGENPADRIIRKASENRDLNNPEKNHSFTYTSYNKFYVTADFTAHTDTLNSLDTTTHKLSRAQKLFKQQHLFLTESVSKRKYKHPGRNHEDVIASRTSGLKTPLFAALGNEMQSFSFYDNTIKLFDRVYVNPLISGSTSKYLFIIEDTLYSGKDSVFVLSFQPKHGKKFDGLKGLLYINTNQYAIQNVIAEPFVTEGLFTIRIQQKYVWTNNKTWFPQQLNTDLYYNDFSISDSALHVSMGRGKVAGLKNKEGRLKVVSRSYISETVLDPILRNSEFSELEVAIAPDAAEKSNLFWKPFRVDTLDSRDLQTYRALDSIGRASKLDLKLKALSALIDGQLPYKYICFDLNRLLDVNEYEKLRLGLGIHTSRRLSRYYSVGGYGAYGFNDAAFKYGGDCSLFPFRNKQDNAFYYSYTHDIVESGGSSFFKEFPSLGAETLRTNLLSVYDKQEMHKVGFSFRAFHYFLCNLFASEETRGSLNMYRYGYAFENGTGSVTWNQFHFTEAGFQLKYIYREKFSEFLDKKISEGSDYPVVYVNVTKGFSNLSNFAGEFSYMKYELKVAKKFITAKAGKPAIQIMAGLVDGNLPYTKLFAGRGTFVNYSIAVPNTFETMGINEFLSDRYISLFYTHDFGRLFFRRPHFQPQVLLLNRIGFGSLSNGANHFGVVYKTMELGYGETGLQLNNLIRRGYLGIGAGAFYRYGPYAYVQEEKNVAIKFSININF
jgi:hypothetical protein